MTKLTNCKSTQVEVKSDSKFWIGETRVERSLAYYRFALKENLEVKSDWRDNPTAAYKEASERAGNVKFSKGSNGRLIIGVTYENLQAEIRQRFAQEIQDLPAVNERLSPTSLANTKKVRREEFAGRKRLKPNMISSSKNTVEGDGENSSQSKKLAKTDDEEPEMISAGEILLGLKTLPLSVS